MGFAAARDRQTNGCFLPTHGQRHSRLYRIWCGMHQRCGNPNTEKYPIYGGRGIQVDPRWQEFAPFAAWAAANQYADDLQIDRRDHNGDYGPDNCRFVTAQINNNNRRNNRHLTAFGETKTVADWGRDPRCVVAPSVIYQRLRKGCLPESALTLPLRAGSSLQKRVLRAD